MQGPLVLKELEWQDADPEQIMAAVAAPFLKD